MKKRWLLNLALGLLVLALALLAVYRPGHQAPPATPLTALAPDSVTKIRIERHGQEAIELARTDGNWRLTAPLSGRANRFNVENLLRLASAPIEASIPASDDLAPYGLTPPRILLRLNEEEIALGGLHPLKSQMYVRYRGAVHLVGAHLQAAAQYSAGQFLDSRLIEDKRKPRAFRLPGFSLTQDEAVWRRAPELTELSTDRINDFVQEWLHASALSIERASLTRPLATIEIAFEGEDLPLHLGIIAHRPEFILRRQDEGLDYHFPEETGKRLLNLAPNKQ